MTETNRAGRVAVTVAIPTFKRPERLRGLLASLPEQKMSAERAHSISVSVLVIDNDPAKSARDVAHEYAVRYAAVPTPGLSAVRNAALDQATDADALVFIDDDELPGSDWLATLVAPWMAGTADLVSGRVISTFETAVDPWIESGRFFRRTTFSEGSLMPFAATNNLLIDSGFVRVHALRFDEAFGLSGGEDIRFTSQAVAYGARIVACPLAIVLDPVTPERLSRSWLMRRAFRDGTTTALSHVAESVSPSSRLARRARWAAVGLLRVVVGGIRVSWGAIARSRTHRARGSRLVLRGSGMTAGAFGVRYREYRSRHSMEASLKRKRVEL